MIVRLVVILVAASALAGVAIAAASIPAFGDREYSRFHACIASIPHPALPATIALLGAEDDCAHVSGIDGSGQARPLERLHALMHGAAEPANAGAFFRRCSRDRRASRGADAQITMGMDCYRHSDGLTGTQVELSTGYDPQKISFDTNKMLPDTPIPSERRFPRTVRHANDGTWWFESCS